MGLQLVELRFFEVFRELVSTYEAASRHVVTVFIDTLHRQELAEEFTASALVYACNTEVGRRGATVEKGLPAYQRTVINDKASNRRSSGEGERVGREVLKVS